MPVGRPKGLPKTGGRQKGVLNKITRDIKALAAEHSEDALNTLAQIAKSGESESARVAAANSLLDRAYGKPRQEIEHSGNIGRRAEELSEDDLIRIASGGGAGVAATESGAARPDPLHGIH